MSILDGGPKRPTHNITAYHEDWAPGLGVGVPISVPEILAEDYIISVQGRVRATGVVSEVTDWTITPGGGGVVSPTRGLSNDDFLVMWYDRHQTADDLVAGDAASGRASDLNLNVLSNTFAWFRNEDLRLRVAGRNAVLDTDPTIPADELEGVLRFSGWSANGNYASDMSRIVDANARAEIGSRRVAFNGRTWNVCTNKTNDLFAADLNSSAFQIIRRDPTAALGPPWVIAMVLRDRDPLGAVFPGTRDFFTAGNLRVIRDGVTTDGAVLIGDGASFITTGPTFVIDDSFFVLIGIFNGVTSEIRINGIKRAAGDTGAGDIAAGDPAIVGAVTATGANAGNGAGFFDFAEIIAANISSDVDLISASNVIENYLMRKFGFR